ncbi:S8 family serine peptidase [Actinomadura sp. DC4]|uniref:S8 family serine peptidase n=1 Tax=Actinomadura sp. DC4 TaxID=3055069 RepID=UPI0025B165FE|nr:S8 family serine peptidase [Actinomadura sp. DC4]MDN3359707.1 S8 family serine peptidase [Actinomadura sp. DC4]
MRALKLGGLAAAGALGLAALIGTPSAAAVKPTPKPTGSPKATPSRSAPPAVQCTPPQPIAALQTEPWAQQRLDFTRVWNLTRGKGVTVAVVDSGVDAGHKQLAGHVTSIDLTHTMNRDCVGHGTAVAGIIAAQDRRSRNLPFVGVAPAARLLSVKFTNQDHTDGADPNLPLAIRTAADHKAKVINVSVTSPDTAALRSAVRYAQAHDALVVAAAGNVTDQDKGTTGPAYPAAYPDVMGVGSLSPDGSVADSSNTVTRVSVSAPGKQVATLWPGGYAPNEEGTSFAAAYVSGTAALVRAYHPKLDFKQVKRRLEATADGSSGTGSGAGMINPVQAVTALLPGEGTDSGGAAAGGGQAIHITYRNRPDRQTRSVALTVTGIALGGTAAAVAGGIFIPMGRRRRWKPGTHPAPDRQDS